MILRLLYSFFFLSLVTGNQRGGYGYPGLLSANPAGTINLPTHVETKSYDLDLLSENENLGFQEPRPVQVIEDDIQYPEKTICFTPSMVHKLVKAALEYVSQMPSDLDPIIDKLDQELNRMSDQDMNMDENIVKKAKYPLDSRSIFKMVNKPKAQTRTNLILKYDLPSTQEPQCREALEKLIEIAYNAYLELEQHPQCREYLYNFASQQPDDRPIGHLEQGPDLKSMISTILDQIDKHKPLGPHDNRYNTNGFELPLSDIPIKQIHEINDINKPQLQEFNIPKVQDVNVPHNQEFNIPQFQEFNIPHRHDYIPNIDYTIKNHEYNVPEIQEYTIKQSHEYNVPQIQEYTIKQSHEYNVPQIQEYTIKQNPEYNNIPQIQEYTIKQSPEYNIPQIQEYGIKQISQIPKVPQNYEYYKELKIPQTHEIDIPQIHETIEETIPVSRLETINAIIKLVKNNEHPEHRNLDRLINIIEENQSHFNPQVLKILQKLLSAQKQNDIPRLNDILLLLLDSQKNSKIHQWPWSPQSAAHLINYLKPDHSGNLDSRIVDIILHLFNKPTDENNTEYILSLLRPIKEGDMDPGKADILLNLLKSRQKNTLHPDHLDVLLKLLKSARSGDAKEIDIIDNLSKWNELGLRPDHLEAFLSLLRPFASGHTDRKPIDIAHFMLTQNHNLNPKHFDFILSFLYPLSGILDDRRVELIHFLLNNVIPYPHHVNVLLSLLQENRNAVLNSRFLEILLFLDSIRLLTPELLETVINLLSNEVSGHLEDSDVKSFFLQLAPFKQSNPKLVVDILTLLNQGGLHANIVEWLQSTNNDVGLPNRDSVPQKIKIEVEEDTQSDYRAVDGGYQTDNDFMSIFKWLDSQGLLSKDKGTNNEIINKILKVLEMGDRELGVVELTYMLKHEKPLVYQPVYYVKYRLPILSFISNMKNLLIENPQLTSDPIKLLQELIVVSNVTEVSPNLQGYPKEEILKLTFNDGDLVQAKILDEQNLNLNEQITYVHGLNADISPEEILALNRLNEAKYYPETRGNYPPKIDKIVEFPPVQYQQTPQKPEVIEQSRTLQYLIERSNEKPIPPPHDNAQPQPK